jgi:hypothetical protein
MIFGSPSGPLGDPIKALRGPIPPSLGIPDESENISQMYLGYIWDIFGIYPGFIWNIDESGIYPGYC